MMLIPCPHCGPRNEDEFVCWSEANPQRPQDPSLLDDAQWNDYLYYHTNPKGWSIERWFHARGCARWFKIERHTVTHEIRNVETSHP
jgi:sarcosine oxidase, subunit delta